MDTIDAIDSQIFALEGEIARLQAQIRELRTRRNALTSPLCRLPLDVLYRVLMVLASGEQRTPQIFKAHDMDWVAPHFRQTAKWTKVFGVCKHIRSVSSAWPLLWSHINLNHANAEWIDYCVRRAGTVPLSITYEESVSRVDTDAVASILPQAEDACIVLSRQCKNPSSIESVLNKRLEFLRAFIYAPSPLHVFALTPRFLGGATSNLTKLVLRNTVLSTGDLEFPSLVHLDFETLSGQEDPHRLLSFLSNCPILESLFLSNGAFERLDENTTPINIPYLKILHVKDVLTSIPAILRIFPIPSQEMFFSIIPSTWAHVESPRITALRGQVYGKVRSLFNIDLESSPAPVVSVRSEWCKEIHGLCTCLTVERPGDELAPKMTYSERCIYRQQETISRMLLSVRRLVVHETPNEQMPSALDYIVNHPGDAVPAIEHIVFEDFRDRFDRLERWLSCRTAAGRRIPVIEFHKCSLQPLDRIMRFGDKISMQRLVDKLLVDGQPI
jgi:hypothetical protein